jgi:hypothetical protein
MLKEAGGGAAAQHPAYSPLLPDNLVSSAQVRSWSCGDDGRTWTARGIAVWAIGSWWAVGLQDVPAVCLRATTRRQRAGIVTQTRGCSQRLANGPASR